jgi:glycosyltransferase involved in cell wall biosynthesis
LLRFYPEVDPARVSVQHLAADSAFTPGGGGDPPAEPYLLYVGKRGYYKNFRQLLMAYLGSERLRKAFLLNVVCGDPWTQEEAALLSQAPDRVRLLRRTDDRKLIALYRGATAFVYPSLYEGFGIPLLEAMGCGTPVVCCSRGSLPEVGGEAVAYFDPSRDGDLSRVLEDVCFNPGLRNRLSEAGIARAATFHWEKFADHVAGLLRGN